MADAQNGYAAPEDSSIDGMSSAQQLIEGVRIQESDAGAAGLEKVVLNMGIGEGVSRTRKKVIRGGGGSGLIAGQKPVITKARKSIANFKLREGMPVGAKVTLRRSPGCTSFSTAW